MNRALYLTFGCLLTVVVSLVGLVYVPNWQLQDLQPVVLQDELGQTVTYPARLDETARRGERTYRSMGCIYCHSQQVRSENFGTDIARGWGQRRSLPRDYLLQDPPLLGTMRTGPDLSNISQRQPGRVWHHLHLYNPRLVSAGSIMPPFAFWYKVVAAAQAVPSDISMPDNALVLRPSAQAEDLVTYLLTLQQAHKTEEIQ